MKTKILLSLTLITMLLISGCKNVDRNIYRVELAAGASTAAAHKGYAVYWKSATNNPPAFNRTLEGLEEERGQIDASTVKVGASLEQVDNLRLNYRTNAAVLPALNAALATLAANASNISYTVSSILGPQTK